MKTFLFFVIAFSVSSSHAQSIFERLTPPLVGAHRGGNSISGTNNTIEKFVNAVKAGTDIIETDLQATKDGVVVIFHDGEMSDDSDCKGTIAEKTYEEVKKCKLKGSKPIGTLEEALIAIQGRAILNAEFKTMDVVIPAIKLIQKYNAYDWVYFQTKAEPEKYQLARSTDNKVALLFKIKTVADLDWILSLNDQYLVVIEFDQNMVTKENIKKVHAAGKLVSTNSWRYGSLEEFFNAACDKVFKLGVDIAIANNIQSCLKQKKHYKLP